MPKTIVRDNESIEDTLARFRRDVKRSGNLAKARSKEYYDKPSVEKKNKRKK